MIEEYRFGLIIIDGKKYENDVEVRWTGEVLLMELQERHIIGVEEVKRAIEQSPETIIIGTGESGLASVSEEARNLIEGRGIELIIDKTEEAVKTFNVMNEESMIEEGKQRKVVGFFHISC